MFWSMSAPANATLLYARALRASSPEMTTSRLEPRMERNLRLYRRGTETITTQR
jgi:hypothetical protein